MFILVICLQLLLFNNANVDVEEEMGFVPLHVACLNGHKRVVEFLVKAGCNINHKSRDGVRAVHLADQVRIVIRDYLEFTRGGGIC